LGRDQARRQKSLAKKKAKREDRRAHLARLHSPDPTVSLATCADWPIIACMIPENLWEKGIGQLIIARRMPDGRVALGNLLVDTFCLGVKNALCKLLAPAQFHEHVDGVKRNLGDYRDVAPEYFAKLVYDAVAYARALGFEPHPDYRAASLLLAGIDASRCSESFQFGKDGKPFYVRGPHESIARAQGIGERVSAAGGHFIVPLKQDE
jgi:hypothetical protein